MKPGPDSGISQAGNILRAYVNAPAALAGNPIDMFTRAEAVEHAIKLHGWQLVFEASIGGQDRVAELYNAAGKHLAREAAVQFVLDHFRAELSTRIAGDRLWLLRLGLVTAKNGDLKTARLLSAEDQALNLLRWRLFRARETAAIDFVVKRAIRNGNSKFLRRLADLVAKPAQDLPSRDSADTADRFRYFLLEWWTREVKMADGAIVPALYTFGDDAMLDYLLAFEENLHSTAAGASLEIVPTLEPRTLRTIWERLGLYRPGVGIWKRAELARPRTLMAGKKLRLFDFRPQARL